MKASAAFRVEVQVLRAEIQQLQKQLDETIKTALDETIKTAVENHTIQVLRDYHLLNEKHEPAHWSK